MRIFLMLSLVFLISAPAMALDEFGSRFGEHAPLALEDNITDFLSLEPAAGEESESENDAEQEHEGHESEPSDFENTSDTEE